MPENDLKLPSRNYWDGFKARNSAMWDKIKDNTFVNMFVPIQEIEDGNSIAAITAVVPGKQAVATAAQTVGKPLLTEATKSVAKRTRLSTDEFLAMFKKDLSELTENEAKIFYDELEERASFALQRLQRATEADRAGIVNYINRLHSKLKEFYDKGFKFVDKRNYKPSGPTVYVNRSPAPKDPTVEKSSTYITQLPFHYRLGGNLRYVNPNWKK